MTLALPPEREDPFVGLADSPPPIDDAAEIADAGRKRATFWHRFRKERFAVGGLVFLLVVIVAAIFAPLIAPYDPNTQNLNLINAGPSVAHWFGTDDLGRDILSRIIWGGRTSLRATFEIVALAAVIAIPLGLVAGFFRGAVDSVIMRLMDAMFSFPPLILALTVAALLGATVNDTALAIGIVFVPGFVRLIRGQVIAVREENFIESARSLGATSPRLIRKHIVPNVASPVIIQVALALGFALLVEAGLSYLGIGEQPPTPSWGGMLQEGFNFIDSAPWALIFPGLVIMFTVLSFNWVADGLRDSLGRERPKASTAFAAEEPTSRLDRLLGRGPEPSTPATSGPAPEAALLTVEDLRIEFLTNGEWFPVMEEATFSVWRGRTLGLVGESGSGKTVSALAVMGLLPTKVSRVSGSARFLGRDLMRLNPGELRQIRGNEISMIFQEPMTSLNPAFTVGNQVAEQVRTHRHLTRDESWKIAVEMLDRVEIPDAKNRAKDYPHAFSGGMRQRVMIAMALSCSPKLLIADEPTTALDVTTQAQIVELLHNLQREEQMAMIFVTHDLGVIADVADDVVVMYAGQIVEQAEVNDLFARPRHPYTEALLSSIPQLTPPGEHLHAIPGMVPRPDQFAAGCRFSDRCPHAVARCATPPVVLRPPLRPELDRPTLDVPTGDVPGVDGREPDVPAADGPGAGPAEPRRDRATNALTRCVRQDELTLAGARADRVDQPFAGDAAAAVTGPPLLELVGLSKQFPVRSGFLRRVTGQVTAVDGVDLSLQAGTTLGLVGESGSGKSTLARVVLRLIDPTGGSIVLEGQDITTLSGPPLRRSRQSMQMIFQDPYSSLDPRQNIAEIVGEPLQIHTKLPAREREQRVIELLGQVGIGRHVLGRQPHEFSGGQRQRIAIARALALEPKLLVCDEPVSALDVSTQSQVINLLSELQDRLGLAYLFIAHDLSVVRHLSDRIAVMYLGKIVEEGTADDVYLRPTHPYTAALLSAIPVPDPQRQRSRPRIVLTGEVGTLLDAGTGCRFRQRCPFAMPVCARADPEPFTTPAGTVVRCHLHTEGPALAGATVAGLHTPA
ncbi:MAG: dipeptide ABC transporter ATP-binding protein [Acidimicrobiales bacterium]